MRVVALLTVSDPSLVPPLNPRGGGWAWASRRHLRRRPLGHDVVDDLRPHEEQITIRRPAAGEGGRGRLSADRRGGSGL